MIRIIRSCTGRYYYICRTRIYANSLIFLFWLVLSSLTLSIKGAILVLCPVQVNSHLGVSTNVLSSHAHLFKETKPTVWVHTQHPRFPPSFQPLRKGGKKIGRRENKTKKLRHKTTWCFTQDLQVSSGNIWFGHVPSFPPLVALLLSPISLEKVVGMGVPWEVQLLWDELCTLGRTKAKCSNPQWKIKCC